MSEPHSRVPDDGALAFALAAAACPRLSRAEADRIYIAIGVGDTFEAIDTLVTVIARDRIPLDANLVATIAAWLDCYGGQAAEPRLRELHAGVESATAQQISEFNCRFGTVQSQYQQSG